LSRLLIALFFLFPSMALADDRPSLLHQICEFAEARLKAVRGGRYQQSWGIFRDDYDKITYRGCIVTVDGSNNTEPDHYRILMKLYALPGSDLARRGWRSNRESDGPDGTSFALHKDSVHCQISGNWNTAGITHPNFKARSEFNIRAECGVRE